MLWGQIDAKIREAVTGPGLPCGEGVSPGAAVRERVRNPAERLFADGIYPSVATSEPDNPFCVGWRLCRHRRVHPAHHPRHPPGRIPLLLVEKPLADCPKAVAGDGSPGPGLRRFQRGTDAQSAPITVTPSAPPGTVGHNHRRPVGGVAGHPDRACRRHHRLRGTRLPSALAAATGPFRQRGGLAGPQPLLRPAFRRPAPGGSGLRARSLPDLAQALLPPAGVPAPLLRGRRMACPLPGADGNPAGRRLGGYGPAAWQTLPEGNPPQGAGTFPPGTEHHLAHQRLPAGFPAGDVHRPRPHPDAADHFPRSLPHPGRIRAPGELSCRCLPGSEPGPRIRHPEHRLRPPGDAQGGVRQNARGRLPDGASLGLLFCGRRKR